MKEILKEELYKEFFPFEDEEIFEKKIEKLFPQYSIQGNTPEPYFFINKIQNKKVIVVQDSPMTYVFLQSEKELVILMITDTFGYNRRLMINELITRSVTNIDIIADDKWLREHKEIVEITEMISRNKSHLGKEYLIKGADKLTGFDEEYIPSPLLWYLLKDANPVRNKMGREQPIKTKNNFVPGLIKVILNDIHNSMDIEKKDLKKGKEKLFEYFTNKLFRDNPRKFLLEDLKSRNCEILTDNVYNDLFSTVKYDRTRWDAYINEELIPYLKDDYKEYLFSLSLLAEEDPKIVSSILFKLDKDNKFGKKLLKETNVRLSKGLIKEFLILNHREQYNLLIDEAMIFVENNFTDDILNNKYEKRGKKEAEAVPFAEEIFDTIKVELIKIAEEANELAKESDKVLQQQLQENRTRRYERRNQRMIDASNQATSAPASAMSFIPEIDLDDEIQEDEIPF